MDLSDKLTQLAQKRDGIDIQLAAISLPSLCGGRPFLRVGLCGRA